MLEYVAHAGRCLAHGPPAICGGQIDGDGATGQLERALRQLIGHALRLGWQVTERTELYGVVVGFGHFIEKTLPRCLTWVRCMPHAPRVGCGTNMDCQGAQRNTNRPNRRQPGLSRTRGVDTVSSSSNGSPSAVIDRHQHEAKHDNPARTDPVDQASRDWPGDSDRQPLYVGISCMR